MHIIMIRDACHLAAERNIDYRQDTQTLLDSESAAEESEGWT